MASMCTCMCIYSHFLLQLQVLSATAPRWPCDGRAPRMRLLRRVANRCRAINADGGKAGAITRRIGISACACARGLPRLSCGAHAHRALVVAGRIRACLQQRVHVALAPACMHICMCNGAGRGRQTPMGHFRTSRVSPAACLVRLSHNS